MIVALRAASPGTAAALRSCMRHALLLVALASCGRIGFDGATSGATEDEPGGGFGPDAGTSGTNPTEEPPDPGCVLGAWSAPLRLTSVSSSADDRSPALSADGQVLVFESLRNLGVDL